MIGGGGTRGNWPCSFCPDKRPLNGSSSGGGSRRGHGGGGRGVGGAA